MVLRASFVRAPARGSGFVDWKHWKDWIEADETEQIGKAAEETVLNGLFAQA